MIKLTSNELKNYYDLLTDYLQKLDWILLCEKPKEKIRL